MASIVRISPKIHQMVVKCVGEMLHFHITMAIFIQ